MMSPRRKTPDLRFWPKVLKTDLCWLWTSATNHGGYGRFWDGDRQVPAHRFAYELLVGPVPEGLELDHLCRNRACVNPDHLEAVTQRQNTLRGVGVTAQNAAKTHCKHGHEFSPENTYLRLDRPGGRECRACNETAWRAYEARGRVPA